MQTQALRRRYGHASTKTTFAARLPDGKIATRSSAHPYTHLIVGRYPGGWAPVRWTTQPAKALAEEEARRIRGFYGMSSGSFRHISYPHVASELRVVEVMP